MSKGGANCMNALIFLKTKTAIKNTPPALN